jgi:hypothetical protein
MVHPLDIIIIERLGSIKTTSIKDFKQEELYKKCGFKKSSDFNKQIEWSVKCEGKKYFIQVFAKTEGRANLENKYDFPPPIDKKLFYGSCAIVGQIKKEDGNKIYTNLSVPLWKKIYEELFGGFEDLATTAKEDEEEEDELANIPKEKKTKEGYLKDGFVIDSSDTEENILFDSEEDEEKSEIKNVDSELSELSEESYDYNYSKL